MNEITVKALITLAKIVDGLLSITPVRADALGAPEKLAELKKELKSCTEELEFWQRCLSIPRAKPGRR